MINVIFTSKNGVTNTYPMEIEHYLGAVAAQPDSFKPATDEDLKAVNDFQAGLAKEPEVLLPLEDRVSLLEETVQSLADQVAALQSVTGPPPAAPGTDYGGIDKAQTADNPTFIVTTNP